MNPAAENLYAPDPPHKWQRMEFDLKALDGLDQRQRAERETNRDLAKPIEQLACDFHETAEGPLAGAPELAILHAQKRMVCMMAKVAISNDKLQRQIYWLTMAIFVLAFVQTIATVFSAIPK